MYYSELERENPNGISKKKIIKEPKEHILGYLPTKSKRKEKYSETRARRSLMVPEIMYSLRRCSLKKGFKVARKINVKLAFTDWFFYNLVTLIKWCKIWYLNLDKAILFPRNQVICLKNGKLWLAATTMEFNIFYWNFEHVSYLLMLTKMF